MHIVSTVVRLAALAGLSLAFACGPVAEEESARPPRMEESSAANEEGVVKSSLTTAQQQARCNTIKSVAAPRGITNTLVYAGIPFHESGLAQCWSEATWTCQGPWSSECGGPVVAGAFDGSCSAQEGGLGMYQLDSGTYSQTLATYGSQVLTVSGNVGAGINVIIEKIRVCPNTPNFGTTADVISWINSATPGTANYDTFMAAMAWCYNGCPPGVTWCDHYAVKNSYTSATQSLLNTFGWSYWYGGGTTNPPGQATGLWPDNWADAGSSSVTLTWGAVSGATSYDVVIYSWNGSAWTYYYTYTTSSASMTFWPQFHNSYYAWAVTAKNSAGAGPSSNWAYFYFR